MGILDIERNLGAFPSEVVVKTTGGLTSLADRLGIGAVLEDLTSPRQIAPTRYFQRVDGKLIEVSQDGKPLDMT